MPQRIFECSSLISIIEFKEGLCKTLILLAKNNENVNSQKNHTQAFISSLRVSVPLWQIPISRLFFAPLKD